MPDEQQITPQQVATVMNQVYALVLACPRGRVTTYGWIGKAARVSSWGEDGGVDYE